MSVAPSLIGAVLSAHVREQMAVRGIQEAEIRSVLGAPSRVDAVRPGRVVAQRIIPRPGSTKPYLMRVFVDVDRTPAAIVTAYWTSRIEKYQA